MSEKLGRGREGKWGMEIWTWEGKGKSRDLQMDKRRERRRMDGQMGM